MANTKISALTSATTPVAGTEVLPIVQSSATKQVSIANLTAGRSVSGTSFVPTGSTIPANGLYLPAANAVGLATNTTNAVYIDASQNVGLGTAAPQEKLEVKTSTATQILVGAGAGFTYGIGRELTFGYLRFYGNQTTAVGYIFTGVDGEWMRINGSGNVGIGTPSPSASAILDAQSTTKGVRMPNMTTTQKNAISSPAAGLMVFDTTLAKLCVYSGSAWQTITSI
jgi:hypothetical protein